MQSITKTTCPYCGVGCGIDVVQTDGNITVRGDKAHPANFGRLCSKGASLHETLGMEGRLFTPRVDGIEVDWDTALNKVARGFQQVIETHGPDSVAFYVSGQLLTEDYYVANKLMKGFIGSGNIDTNSRLCMSSSVVGHKRAFGSDTVPCSYEDLEQAELIVLTGSNAAWCHPVLFQRIRQAKKDNPELKIVVIDPRQTDTCDIADLHLPLASGSDAILFNGLLVNLNDGDKQDSRFTVEHTNGYEEAIHCARKSSKSITQVAEKTACAVEDIETFYRWFGETEKTVTVYSQGINQSSSGTDKVNAIINCHLFTGRIGRPGMGPFSFTGQPNAMGGREVGGLANQLAAHMDLESAQHRDLVREFWGSSDIASKQGLKAVELFNAIDAGEIKAVWIMSTNPVVSVPDADRVKKALQKCELVVVSDCVEKTDTNACADVLLPALAWGEKDGTVTNSERRISRQRKFASEPGDARADWWIISEVAKRLGHEKAFNYQGPVEIFREYAELTGFRNNGERDLDISGLAKLNNNAYDNLKPVQWPINPTNPTGTERMFADGLYFTENRKANFLPITPRVPVNPTDSSFPLVLNTGRVRDQWHTMTRTAKTPRLNEHTLEPYVSVHPQDLSLYGLANDGLAKVFSRWGEIVVRVKNDDRQQRGSVFVPMHWNDQFASCARVDVLVNPEVDPLSGQPELKHTPVRVQAYKPAWYGFLLSTRKLNIENTAYWVQAKGKNHYRYELAGEQGQEDWAKWARELLCTKADDINWVEFADVKAQRYRAVRMQGSALESCIFISPDNILPARDWLASLFQKDVLQKDERASLLTGKAPKGVEDGGQTICACFGVGKNKIIDTIKSGAVTAEEIGLKLQAGTNCGSCVPELKQLIAKYA